MKFCELVELRALCAKTSSLGPVLNRRPSKHELKHQAHDRIALPERNRFIHLGQRLLVVARFEDLPHFVQKLAHTSTSCRLPYFRQSKPPIRAVDNWGQPGMWWLQFEEGNAAVVAATSLVQARLIAVAHGLGRASKFVDGYPIDADFLQFIPGDLVGKELSKKEASEVLERRRVVMKYASRAP
jgi:hypothetical protein